MSSKADMAGRIAAALIVSEGVKDKQDLDHLAARAVRITEIILEKLESK